jgi:flagellar protein FlaG
MNFSGIKSTVTPIDSGGVSSIQSQAQQASNVSVLADRQPTAKGGNEQPQTANVVDLHEQLVKAAETISDLVQSLNLDSDLQFQVDDSTGTNIITVIDGKTGDIIRSFPSEESLAIARYIAEFADAPTVGLLTDQIE